MKCPECGAWTAVMETRTNPRGKRRRYECGNKHRFTTQESVAPNNRARRITQWGAYVPRERHPNEALPPENNLWTRPVYNPARDNK